MKKIILFLLLICYIFTGAKLAKNDSKMKEYVRLHILANSNSPFDQGVKIRVKGYLLNSFKNEFENLKSKEETLEFVKDNKELLKREINNFLKESKINYSCDIEIKKEIYKKGKFKSINLPYGEYDSVKILLGKGTGKNLFFILFPSLICDENVTVKATGEKEIKYKSKIFELLKKAHYRK